MNPCDNLELANKSAVKIAWAAACISGAKLKYCQARKVLIGKTDGVDVFDAVLLNGTYKALTKALGMVKSCETLDDIIPVVCDRVCCWDHKIIHCEVPLNSDPLDRALLLMIEVIQKDKGLCGIESAGMILANVEMIRHGGGVIIVPTIKRSTFSSLLTACVNGADVLKLKEYVKKWCIVQ